MSCVYSSSIEVLINGRRTSSFQPLRCTRQGDSMFPYFFILCMKRLSATIDREVTLKGWDTIKISKKGPKLSYLFFDDDLTLSATTDIRNCNTIKAIFNHFQDNSGQKVNLAKSRVIFSKNCSSPTRNLCATTLGIQEHSSFSKYLGFSIFHHKPTNRDF